MKRRQRLKFGQPSWRISTCDVEAFVTETGGHLGPVTFRIGGKKIQPFAIAPWAEETTPRNLPAMLKFSEASGSGRLSTSRFLRGHVAPKPWENPAAGGYSCLKSGSVFRSLEKVRTQDGGWTDLTAYPTRRGFEDLVLLETDLRQA